MHVHLVDGTYELFRTYFGAPPASAPDGREVGATRGLLRTLLSLLRDPDVSHVGVAFDHVIESFRNDLFAGYKTGAGVPEDLLAQFPLAERAARALGLVVWPMVEFEADDAMATAVHRWQGERRVARIVVCTPDKDLAQCVAGDRVVQLDRRSRQIRNEAGVRERFGVAPPAIPDWLALVGDQADGIPGVPGWGAKSTSAVLGRYGAIADIPPDASAWDVSVRGAARLARNLVEHREAVGLYRELATLRVDVPLTEHLDDLEWRGALPDALTGLCAELDDPELLEQVHRWDVNA